MFRAKIKKISNIFGRFIFIFTAEKFLCILHGQVFVMLKLQVCCDHTEGAHYVRTHIIMCQSHNHKKVKVGND